MGFTATASSNAPSIADDEKGVRAFAGPPCFGRMNALVSSRGLRLHGGGDGGAHRRSAAGGGFLRGGRGGGAVNVAA